MPTEPVDDENAGEAPRRRIDSPADTLISPRLWKHVLIGIAGLLAWGALLFFGDRADQSGSGLRDIIGLQADKLATFYSTGALLAAGQLAFITLWYRSRSRKDFSGSYKLWLWTALAWLTLCAFRATGSHWTLADAVIEQSGVRGWNLRLMLWLAPAAVVVVAVHRLLHREMRDCRGSLWLIRGAASSAAAAALSLLLGEYCLSPRAELLVQTGAASLWHCLLAMAMLIHCRHVIHFTNEAARSPIRRFRLSLPKLRWPRFAVIKLPKVRLPRRARATPQAAAEAPPATPEPRPKAPASKPAAATAPTAGKPAAESSIQATPAKPQPPAAQKPIASPEPAAESRPAPPKSAPKPHFQLPRQEREDADDFDDDDADESDAATRGRSSRKKGKRRDRQRS